MSQQKPAFKPNVMGDRVMQLESPWIKGQDQATLKLGRRGNRIGLTAFMNDQGKNRIQAIFDPQAFFIFLETLRMIARNPNEGGKRFNVSADTKKSADGQFLKTWVSIGREEKSGRIFIGMIDAQNEGMRKQFFFGMPKFTKFTDDRGEKIDAGKESCVAAAGWSDMVARVAAQIMVDDYMPPQRGGFGGGGQGGGGGGRNYGGGGGGGYQKPAAPAPEPSSGGGNESFSDDDFAFN